MINDFPANHTIDIELNSFSMTINEYKAEINFRRAIDFDPRINKWYMYKSWYWYADHSPKSVFFRQFDWSVRQDLQVVASAKKICTKNKIITSTHTIMDYHLDEIVVSSWSRLLNKFNKMRTDNDHPRSPNIGQTGAQDRRDGRCAKFNPAQS